VNLPNPAIAKYDFIKRAKRSKLFWYGLLAVVIAIDIATLIDYGHLNLLRIVCILVTVTTASFVAIISGGLLTLWQWRTQKIPPTLKRRKLMLAWCRGALRGGLFALVVMPLILYEEFDGPGFIISIIRILQGCQVGTCVFGYNYMFARLMVLSIIPFVLGLTAAIVSARKSWCNCIAAETVSQESP
jgi:L-cystine uptake protein TcyP (sodium:dicarboxylate symporter family)